jgi:hypothetical protein
MELNIYCYRDKGIIILLYLIVVNSQSLKSSDCLLLFLDILLNVHLCITIANDQLDEQILIHLLQSCTCTCFEQYLAHSHKVIFY